MPGAVSGRGTDEFAHPARSAFQNAHDPVEFFTQLGFSFDQLFTDD